MVHIYGISLAKGNQVFTPAFEAALSRCGCRPEVIALFDSLPFYLRTPAGVVITHAGAAAPMAEPGKAQQLFNWDHQQFLAWADKIMMTEDIEALRRGYARMSGLPYEQLADHYLAVSGPDDPRYDDLLRGFLATSQPLFDQLLWPALFTRCEHEYGRTDYAIFLDALLQELSIDFSPQQILIAGHISINGGHKIIAKRHLRLASAHHAIPRKAGQYLLFDTAEPVLEPKNLVAGLRSVYP